MSFISGPLYDAMLLSCVYLIFVRGAVGLFFDVAILVLLLLW